MTHIDDYWNCFDSKLSNAVKIKRGIKDPRARDALFQTAIIQRASELELGNLNFSASSTTLDFWRIILIGRFRQSLDFF